MFKTNHFDLIKRKLTDLFDHTTDEARLGVVLKTMHVIHKLKSYAKNEDLKKKLQDVVDGKASEDVKSWARKLLEDQ